MADLYFGFLLNLLAVKKVRAPILLRSVFTSIEGYFTVARVNHDMFLAKTLGTISGNGGECFVLIVYGGAGTVRQETEPSLAFEVISGAIAG